MSTRTWMRSLIGDIDLLFKVTVTHFRFLGGHSSPVQNTIQNLQAYIPLNKTSDYSHPIIINSLHYTASKTQFSTELESNGKRGK